MNRLAQLYILVIFLLLAGICPGKAWGQVPSGDEAAAAPGAENAAKAVIQGSGSVDQAVAGQDVESEKDEEWDDESWEEEDPGEYDPAPDLAHVYSLERCISLVFEQNREVRAAHWEISYYNAKADEAWWAWFPQITFTSVLTAAPDYDPPETTDPTAWLDYSEPWYKFDGVVWGNTLEMTAPLYTFGKIGSLRDMGPLGRKAGKYKLEAVRNKLIYEVKRAYFTLQMLEKMREVLDEGIGYVETAEKKMKELLAEGSDSVTEIDRYKFEVVRADLLGRIEEIEKNRHVILQAMRTLLNLPDATPFYLGRRFPKSPKLLKNLEDRSTVREEMQVKRPEFHLLDVQLELQQKEERRQWAYYFPDFFLWLQYRYSVAPSIKDIGQPFLSDPYNSHYVAGYIGLRYTFDLPLQMARDRQQKAKLRQIEHRTEYQKSQLKLQLEDSYRNYLEQSRKLEIHKIGQKSGRKWMITALMSYNIGLLESSDMVEAIAAYFKTQLSYYSTMHSSMISEARLEYVLGNQSERYSAPTTQKDTGHGDQAPSSSNATPIRD